MKHQAPGAQKINSAIHRINHYLVDKYWENQLHYPVDRDLSGGWYYPSFEQLEPAGPTFSIPSVTLHIRQHEGVDIRTDKRTDNFVTTKMSEMHR